MTPLPPLACLQAFEASARHLSFTRAGQELHLSPSAVSRQIAQLEDYLGRRLFAREHNALRLTPAGETYAVDVRRMLEMCISSTAQLMARTVKSRLTVSCTAGLFEGAGRSSAAGTDGDSRVLIAGAAPSGRAAAVPGRTGRA